MTHSRFCQALDGRLGASITNLVVDPGLDDLVRQ